MHDKAPAEKRPSLEDVIKYTAARNYEPRHPDFFIVMSKKQNHLYALLPEPHA